MSTSKQFFGTSGSLTGDVGSYEDRKKDKLGTTLAGSILVACPNTDMVEFLPKKDVLDFFGDQSNKFTNETIQLECTGSCPICGLVFETNNPPNIL